MMIRTMLQPKSLLALASTLLLGACGSSSDAPTDDYAEGVPELAAVQMSITNNPASEAVATDADAVDAAALAGDELAATVEAPVTGASDLDGARETVRELNQAFRASLQAVAALVKNSQPTELRGVRIWGPVTRGLTEFRFLMTHPTPRAFRWRIDARVAGSTTAYSRVAAGEITVGIAARRGKGVAGFDLTALSAVDPEVQAHGVILAGFAHGALGTTLAYAAKDFARDSATAPVNALLQEVHLKGGVNRVRLAYRGNVAGTATDAQELVLARVRHTRGVGGRSDVIATGGDVADGHAWVISQCWDAALSEGYRIVRDCSLTDIGGTTCTEVTQRGQVSACSAAFAAAEFPPVEPNANMDDSDDPNGGVTAPSSMPNTDDLDG